MKKYVDRLGYTTISCSTRIQGRRCVLSLEEQEDDSWDICLIIGATRQAKKYITTGQSHKARYTTTKTNGEGLASLRWALHALSRLLEDVDCGVCITAIGVDSRRHSAYRYLSRFGFTETVFPDGQIGYMAKVK